MKNKHLFLILAGLIILTLIVSFLSALSETEYEYEGEYTYSYQEENNDEYEEEYTQTYQNQETEDTSIAPWMIGTWKGSLNYSDMNIFWYLEIDEDGFAMVKKVVKEQPKDQLYLTSENEDYFYIPLDRYYMEETLAPKAEEMLSQRLLVMHNLWFYNHLMEDIRKAIDEDRFAEFKAEKEKVLGNRI